MSHYFTNDDHIRQDKKEISFILNNKSYTFFTDNGVFSKRGLDKGTKVLLENIPLSEIKGKVLDFGCGYGVIGIYLAINTKADITLIDINTRALALAKENSQLNKVNVNILESNIYENVTEKYDYIITNPPIRVGKKILYEILFQAKQHLVPGGELWLVVNKNQGAKSLARDLEKEYLTQIRAKNKEFYVICCQNR